MCRLVALALVLVSGFGLMAPEPSSRLLKEWESKGQVYLLEREDARGTVLVVHSVFQDHQTSLPMARTLWRSGYRSLVVELQPGSQFSDYVSVVEELAGRFKEQGKVYAVGHSMGADIICTAAGAQEDLFEGLVALGFPVDRSSLKTPLLIGAGAWDQVHSRDSLASAAEGGELVLSPFSDHSQETLDPYLQKTVVEFFGGEMKGRWWSLVLAQGVFFLSLTSLAIMSAPQSRARFLLGVGLVALGLNLLWPHLVLSTLAVSGWASSAWKSSGESGKDSLKAFLLLVTSIGLSWLLHGYQSVLAQPVAVLGLPIALFSWLPILSCRLVNTLVDPVSGQASLLMLLFLFVELTRPGLLLGWPRRGMSSVLDRIGTLEVKLAQKPGPVQAGLLSVLILGGVAAWRNVLKAGYALGVNDLMRLGWKISILFIFPILAWMVLVRLFSRSSSSTDPLS